MTILAFAVLLSVVWIACGENSASLCDPGWNYPESCPRPGDPPDRTKCCRDYYSPSCCQEKEGKICASKEGVHQVTETDPGSDWGTVWCPSRVDDDDATLCEFAPTNTTEEWVNIHCNRPPPSSNWHMDSDKIAGGVLGVMTFVALLVIVLVVFMGLKKRSSWTLASLSGLVNTNKTTQNTSPVPGTYNTRQKRPATSSIQEDPSPSTETENIQQNETMPEIHVANNAISECSIQLPTTVNNGLV